MNPICLYLLPLFAVLNTLLSCFLVYRAILACPAWRKAFVEATAHHIAYQFPLQELVQKKLNEEGMQAFRDFMENRYEGFMQALKQRIPMASMVLTGNLETSLKEQVQVEIEKLLPEFKQLIMDRVMTPEELEGWIKDKLELRIPSFKALQRKYCWRILFSLFAISLSFGLVQLLGYLFFCEGL
jgi:hypothetical protein